MKENYFQNKLEGKSLSPIDSFETMSRIDRKLFDSDFSLSNAQKQVDFEEGDLEIKLSYGECGYTSVIDSAEERHIDLSGREAAAKKWRKLDSLTLNYNV